MAYGIQNLRQAMMGTKRPRQDVQRLARMGRRGDDTVGHLTSGEMVIPKTMQSPGIMSLVAGKMRQRGVNPSEYIVGSPHAQANANPYTGAQQFPEPGGAGQGPGDGGYGGGDRDGGGGGWGDADSAKGTTAERGLNNAGYGNALGDASRDNTIDGVYQNKWERFKNWISSGAGIGSLVGGAAGLLSPVPGGAALGRKLGEKLGAATDNPFGGMDSWGSNAYGAHPESPTQNNGMAGSTRDVGLGDRNYDGSMGGGIGGLGGVASGSTIGMHPTIEPNVQQVDMANPTGAPSGIDFENYGSGPETLRYPWQLPGGEMSYGQYPLYGGVSGHGTAPLDPTEGSNGNFDILNREFNMQDYIKKVYGF